MRLLGHEVPAPVCVAPVGYQTLAHPDGEVAMARGARRAGALLTVSSRSSRRIEEVAAEAGPWWFQVYVLRDRGLTRELVRRAAGAGAAAIALTGDTPYLGRRRRDRDPGLIPDDVFGVNLGDGFDRALAEQAPDVTYDDIGWLREVSGLPVVVKGVLRGDDARSCAAAGAAGVWVSNHGGRQLDGALPTAGPSRRWPRPLAARSRSTPTAAYVRASTCCARSPSGRGRCSWAVRRCGASPRAARTRWRGD